MREPDGLTRAELAAWLQTHYGAQSVTVRAWSPIADSCNEVTNAAGRHPDGAWYVAFDLAMPDEEEPEPLTVQLGEKDGQLTIYCTWEGYRLVEEQQNDPQEPFDKDQTERRYNALYTDVLQGAATQSIEDDLEELARVAGQHGFMFEWITETFQLRPMTEEEQAAFTRAHEQARQDAEQK